MNHLLTLIVILFWIGAEAQTKPGIEVKDLLVPVPIMNPIFQQPVFYEIDTLHNFRDTLPVIMMVTSMRNSGETKRICAKLGYRLYNGKHMYFTNMNFDPLPEYIIIWDYKRRP